MSHAPTARRQRTNHQRPDPTLRCRATLRDGRPVSGELSAERHQALQLWMLHRATAGLVELTPGTRDLEGRLHVDRRSRREHYLPGGPAERAVEEIRNRFPSRSIRGEVRPYAVCELGHGTPSWVWLRNRTWNSYPVRAVTRAERRLPPHERPEQYAHRYLWTQRYRPIPLGLQLDHLCNVRACVSPDHLEPVTASDNHARRLLREAARERRDCEAEGELR